MARTLGYRKPLSAFAGASLLLVACGSDSRLVPLSVGKRWDYRFRWGVQREMGQVEVAREVSVGDEMGYELKGPMGVSRIGYAGNRLVADQLGGAFLTPPLPIGVPLKTKAEWHGWLVTPEGKQAAKATTTADAAKLEVGGRKKSLNRTVVELTLGDGKTIELTTWYAPGEGIVQQEQRTGGTLDLGMERVSGG